MSGTFKVIQMADGDWLATTSSPVSIGVFASGRELALERLRERVEYRQEMATQWAEEYKARTADEVDVAWAEMETENQAASEEAAALAAASPEERARHAAMVAAYQTEHRHDVA